MGPLHYTCQVCGWSMTWTDRAGRSRRYIHVDHILDKAGAHGEECHSLWVLCPNCHARNTYGLILIDLLKHQVLVEGREVSIRDHHLWVEAVPKSGPRRG
jgi:5-methylcytosine-specific restriction endonuclease McrA